MFFFVLCSISTGTAALLYADTSTYSHTQFLNTRTGRPLFQLNYYTNDSKSAGQYFTADIQKDLTFAFSYWSDVLTSKDAEKNTGYIPIKILYNPSLQYNAMAYIAISATGNNTDGYLSALA